MGERFEQAVLPHLDAAYNLARWLMRSDADAQDMVQESYLRALKAFDTFRGGDSRAWLLSIVRNTCYTWLKRNRSHEMVPLDEQLHDTAGEAGDPQAMLIHAATVAQVREAIEALPAGFREVIVLHELEGLSYKQIAEVAGIPIGTVMSRLARARQKLHENLADRVRREV